MLHLVTHYIHRLVIVGPNAFVAIAKPIIFGCPLYLTHLTTGDTTVTRGCLSTLIKETQIREDIPSVRRHSYCIPAKSDPTYGQSYITSETKKLYCFCNDLWLCNTATTVKTSLAFCLVGYIMMRLL